MDRLFKRQPGVKEISKAQQNELKGTSKSIDRDLGSLDRDMTKLENEIKMAMKRGDEGGARILAKQLVKMREQRTRMVQVKGQVNTTSYAVKSMGTTAIMTEAMSNTTKAMGAMNEQMNITQVQKMSNTYQMESEKMNMKSELMDETYDSIFEGDEELESNVMNQIYDEIGLEYSSTIPQTPSSTLTLKNNAAVTVTDDDVESFIKSQINQQTSQ